MARAIIIRVKSIYKQKKLRFTSTLTAVDMKVNGRATNDTVKVLSSGQVEVLTAASLRTTAEMEKVKCFTQTAPSTMVLGETTHVTAEGYLIGLKALVDSREISEMTRCMEMVRLFGRVAPLITDSGA